MGFLRRLAARVRGIVPRRGAAPTPPPRRQRERTNARIPRRRGPGGAPDSGALISAARASGKAAAKSGGLDQWSFGNGAALPYVDHLWDLRDRAISAARERQAAARQDDRDDLRQITAEAASTRRNQQELEEQRSEALSFMRTARSKVNRLARLEARQREERSLAMPLQAADEAALDVPLSVERPGDEDDWPGDADGRAGAADGTPSGGQLEQDAPPENDTATVPDGSGSAGWSGPEAPRMTARWTGTILLLLILVEVPIQYVIFQHFHGYSPIEEVLTWVFTLPVSAIMVLVPHLAGWWYRDRVATGADGLMRFAPLALLVPWAYLAVMLGYLRARVLLAPLTVAGTSGSSSSTSYLNGSQIPNTATSLHVTPTTMSVMFVALILGVGGIGFMLGIAREHPLIGAYRGAREARRQAGEELRGLAEPIRLADELSQARDEQDELSDEQWERHIQAIRATFAAAAHAYLAAISDTMGDPAVTESVTRMSQRIAAEEGAPSGDQVPVG
jgi:hypothetical protein